MVYAKPEIVATFSTEELVGTAIGFGSVCVPSPTCHCP
jgi:hypothetical protein